jgi:peroxiredoxin
LLKSWFFVELSLMVFRFGFLLACACLLLGSLCVANEARSPIGNKVADFTLDNCYGKPVSLADFDDRKAIAIVFLGTECPLAKLYGRRLAELQTKYEAQGVVVLGINSNTQDSLTELVAYGHRYGVNFPLLKDVGNRVADAIGAERTPEVFLLDADRIVRYHGRIDDQYGVGYSRERTVHPDLAVAIDQLLAGESISVPQTEVVGCHIGRVQASNPTGEITYSEHIAAIFNARCVRCHREQEIAPFALQRYEDILGWEDTILEVIDDGRMPPWFADPSHGKFANDARLTDREKQLIATWVENGMPQGDPELLPEPPQFTTGWQIPEPDQVIKMREKPFRVPSEGVVDYQRFVVDPGWKEDKYIYAAEARPDNRSVVHHILVYVIPPGERGVDLRKVLVGYAPGGVPISLDDGVALHVEANSKLLFEMHYTPNGYATDDLSYAGVCFVDKSKVKKLLRGRIAINHEFEIPPNASNHEVLAQYFVKRDEMLVSMTPHMHLRGKAYRYEARYPDGTRETLLDIPHYDFNWQLKYVLDQPKRLPRGTVIECTAVYDNSERNLANPDPTRTVRWGDQSWNEMMIGFMDTLPIENDLP